MGIGLSRLVVFLLLNVLVTNISASERFFKNQPQLKIATFNVNMDATNYLLERGIGTVTKPFNRQLTNSDVATHLFSEWIQINTP
ncbi:MAG: hypothetical protein HRU38_00995 [Saccharospirillaceae bacterium]|nr:hypothetical protein [Colwellia sp.]NRB77237.1 hypothetical protein [Saccharospirillaceae bacterium]